MQHAGTHVSATDKKAPEALYSRESRCIIDVVESGRCKYTGLTLDQASRQYPDAEILPVETALSLRDESNCTPVTEISNQKFIEMLEVLPPMNWHVAQYTESFMLSEFYSGEVTSIYVRVGIGIPRYFTFRGSCRLSHAAILAKVTDFIGRKQAEVLQPEFSDVGVIDARLVLGGHQLHLFTDWVSKAASYRPVNGSTLRMLNADLQPWDAVDGRVISNPIAAELIALDPEYLIVCEELMTGPASTRMLSCDLAAELPSYEDPAATIEWSWLAKRACMAHVENGSALGVWEFVIQTSKLEGAQDVPTVIKEVVDRAREAGADFVLFHQGT